LKLVKTFLLTDADKLLESDAFNIAISVVIAVNSIVMAIELDVKWGGWVYVENMFMATYFIEVALKLKTYSWKFFVDKNLWAWNWLDFTIVSVGVFDSWLTPLIQLFQQEVWGQEASQHPGQMKTVTGRRS